MKSLFAPASFGRPQMGIVSLRGQRNPARFTLRRLGQDDFFEDILEDIGLSDVENITEELDTLLAEVPVGALRDSYEKRRAECMDKSLISRYKCLYDLFQDIKRDLRGDDAAPTPPAPTPAPTPTPKEENGFPIVPVAIGGVVLAVIVYALVRK